jgi:hypothetical protein
MSTKSPSAAASEIFAATPAVSPAPEEMPVSPAVGHERAPEEHPENSGTAVRLPATLPEASAPVVCPVCRARFRGAEICSRCGADLSPLLLLSAHAFRLRGRARELLGEGNFRQALACVEEAERLRSTPHGALLRILCACLAPAK